MSFYHPRIEGEERQPESALHDEQDREFVHTNLHRVCANQGRGCEGCTEASRNALRGLWGWVTYLTPCEWGCVALVIVAVGALVSN